MRGSAPMFALVFPCLVLACGLPAADSRSENEGHHTSELVTGPIYKPTIVGPWRTLFEPTSPGPGHYMNDHTLFKGADGKWRIVGINGSGPPQPNSPRPEVAFASGVSNALFGPYTQNAPVARYCDAIVNNEEVFDPSCVTTCTGACAGHPVGAVAPHAVQANGVTYLFFASGVPGHTLGLLTSTDSGATWTPRFDATIDSWPNPGRDPMVLLVGSTYYMYITTLYNGRSAIAYATSTDLLHWTLRGTAWTTSGTATEVSWSAAESPFVVKVGDYYYLSTTLTDSAIEYHQTLVFRSKDPTNFGDYSGNKFDPAGSNFVTELPVHAPEFVQDPATSKWYITTCGWEGSSIYPEAHHGVAIAEIEWQPVAPKPVQPHDVPRNGLQMWLAFDNDGVLWLLAGGMRSSALVSHAIALGLLS